MSWYKAIGYPTGVGSLIARRDALARLRRPWFAGGAIGVASVAEPRHTLAPDHMGFEDGTIDFLSLPAVEIGIRHLEAIGMDTIHDRVRHLTRRMLAGSPRCSTPTGRRGCASTARPTTGTAEGPFRSTCSDPMVRSSRSPPSRHSRRPGGSPSGPAASATRAPARPRAGITADDMRAVFALGHQPRPDELQRILGPKALGAVRASVGIASDERDVDRLVAAVAEFPTPA